MSLEVLGFVLLAWLVAHTSTAVTPSALSLAVILFLIGFGQGLALPTLMRMITGRVAPAYSGMIAGITSSTLQISTALSVAIIGGIFYTLLGKDTDAAAITHAFTVAVLCIAACLAVGAGLSLSLARQPAAELQTAAMHPAE
jgi:MFS family permease